MVVNREVGGDWPRYFFDHINDSRDMGHPSWPDHLSRLHVLEEAPQGVAIFHFHLLTTWPCAFPGSSRWALIHGRLLVCTHLQALFWCTGFWQHCAVSIRRTASAPEICSEEEKKHKTRANKHKVESSKSLMVYWVRIFCPVEWCSSRREQQSKTWFTCLDRKSKYVSFININSDLSVTGWYNCTNMEVRCQERLFTLTCTSEWVGAFLFPSVYHSILLTHLSLHVGPAPWNHLLLSLWPPPLLPPLLCLPLVFLPFIQLFPLSSGPDNGTLAAASRRAHQADWVFSQRSPRASG